MHNSSSTVEGPVSLEALDELFLTPKGPLPLLLLSAVLYLTSTVVTYIEYRSSLAKNASVPRSRTHTEDESRGSRVRRPPMKPQREDSPNDLRDGSPHPAPDHKANGEMNRRLFYRYLLQSQLLRLLFLPLAYIYEDRFQITSIVANTFPTISSALAYAILILFFAQVTRAASGRSRIVETLEVTIAKGSCTVYAILIGLNCVIPVLTGEMLFYLVKGVLCIVYLGLFISMTFFGLKMKSLLNSSMARTIGCRLMGMSTVCCISFILRSIIFGWEVYSGLWKAGNLLPALPFWNDNFGKTVIGYLTMEWTPAVVVLILMHKKKNRAPEQEPVINLEGGIQGQLSPLTPMIDQQGQGQGPGQYQQDARRGQTALGLGVKRSISANGGVAVPSKKNSFPQVPGQQRMVASASASVGGADLLNRAVQARRPETVSLLGDKSQSAEASSTNMSSLYGATNT